MTLSQHFEKAKSQPRPLGPAVAFVREIAQVTKKNECTVYRWLSGAAIPDALTRDVLARHFNTTPEELFPAINQ